jgi:endonuclease-3
MVESERKRVKDIIGLLKKEYPGAKVTLNYSTPLELLIATMLSAQCTDERVNLVTKHLFEKYSTTEEYARATSSELEEIIRPTGFYHVKARNIKNACTMLVEKFNSKIPNTLSDLTLLPGVARKTANVVLSNAYGIIEGIAVDTHVTRLSQRLGLTSSKYPKKIEQDLMRIVPREEWRSLSYLFISHGRNVCSARKPLCAKCVLNQKCPSVQALA